MFSIYSGRMLRDYLLMTTLGYFGIKVVNGALKALPFKPTSQEMMDYTAATVLGGVLFILNNMQSRSIIGDDADFSFKMIYYFAFAMGLTVPFAKNNVFDKMDDAGWDRIKVVMYGVVATIVLISFYISFTTQTGETFSSIYYLLYVLSIALILMGLVFTKQSPLRYPTTDKATGQKSLYETAGQSVNVSLALSAWVISMLFVADSENGLVNSFITFLQGVFYGVFVGAVSLYGLDYLIRDTAPQQCVGEQCNIRGMYVDDKPYQNLANQVSTIKWTLGITIFILIVIIILFYTSAAEFIPFSD